MGSQKSLFLATKRLSIKRIVLDWGREFCLTFEPTPLFEAVFQKSFIWHKLLAKSFSDFMMESMF